MKYFRFSLIAIAWIVCVILFYISVVNSVTFVNFTAANLKESYFLPIYGILVFNLIACLFSLMGLALSTFNSSLLRTKIGLRKIILTGVCMFPIANLVEWVGGSFEVTRYHLSGFAISIFVSALIAGAISTAWRNKEI